MMGTSTELFGVIPVKLSRRMERIHGNKRRALTFGCPTRDNHYTSARTERTSAAATTSPIQTCCVLEQQEHQPLHSDHQQQHQRLQQPQQQCNGENHRNVNNCRLSSNVFRGSTTSFMLLAIISIFSSCLIRPGNGLEPQCRWSLYQDMERLNCDVETGDRLIVEDKVQGVGPEHAKSLWVQCGSTFSDIPPPSGSVSANVNEGVQQQHPHHHHHQYGGSGSNNNNNNNNNASPGGFVISQGILMSVPNLRDLRLDNCKIKGITEGAFSYLPNLQNLTIRAHTSLSSWPSTSSLEIQAGVLRDLPDLHQLDLSTTSIGSLPDDFLCFVPKLQHLNLSNSFLRDFQGIIPSDPTNPPCGSSVKSLDLSGNYFTLLPPATFAAVSKSLLELIIQRTSITIVSERALLGVTLLNKLDLSSNLISSLPPEIFHDNKQLREIYFQNNKISVIAPGVFSPLKNSLVVLDLSNNELTSEWVEFGELKSLQVLNLHGNQLNYIPKDAFSHMSNLYTLILSSNNLQEINSNAFSKLSKLYTLVLSHNQLKQVDSNFCNGLNSLSFLSLDNNKIENVESFKTCPAIQDLNLSENLLKELPEALNDLVHLKTLDLGENKISDVGNLDKDSGNLNTNLNEFFPHLYGLRLTGNAIQILPSLKLPALKILNLSRNNITQVDVDFGKNPNLQAIRLDQNKIKNITGIFNRVEHLLFLNISGNELEELNYEDFPQRLQFLDANNNRINMLSNCMDVELRIKHLDLSSNFISEIQGTNIPDSIQTLILRSNRIHQIKPYTLYKKPNISSIDVRFNQLVNIDENALRLGPDHSMSVTSIFLGQNPLICDCTMEFLQNLDATSGQYPVIQDENLQCSLPFDKQLHEFSKVRKSQFLCPYKSNCFNTCKCCDYDACDCKMTCPKNCTCYHDLSWTTNLVDCSMQEQMPSSIPMDVTELRLDGGNAFSGSVLSSHSFIGRKVLRIIYLNDSQIDVIQNRTFNGLKASLKVLHLDHNLLERLEDFYFQDLENLEELYLDFNRISWIANDTFASLYKLKVLTLHNNNLDQFPVWHVTTRIGRLGYTLQDITLSGNEWSCECQFATQFKEFLIEYRGKISDASEVQCVDQVSNNQIQHTSSGGGGTGESGGNVNGQESKSQTELIVVRLLDQKNHKCLSSSSSTSLSTDISIVEPTKESDDFNLAEYVPYLVCIPVIIILAIIICLMSYYWRESLRIWVHSRCGLRLCSCRERESSGEKDKLFDAFISYSNKDEAWVRQVLANELERHDPPYRICLRYRDLPSCSNGNYLGDTIVQASDASRRLILVLSHHFLKGEWSRTDVKSAHHSVLKDRHRKVIIILLGDLPSKDLDPDIRLYLKNHTYLNCDDKKFWEKLRYALPDVKVKVPVFRGIQGRNSSSRNNSQQHRSGAAPPPPTSAPASGTPLQPQNHHHLHHAAAAAAAAAAHHHYNQPSPNLSQAHHMTHLGPNTQNNITSPLIGPPPPLTAPPVPGLLANLPPNIPNGALGPHGHHPHHATMHHGGGPVTTVIGGGGVHGIHGGSTASISTSSNNSGSQRAPQRHPSHHVNSAHHPNSRQNTAIHI